MQSPRHRVTFPSTSVALAAIIFAAVYPTLSWQEFSSSMESLNVATAMEIRRTGNWLIPTLQGETRLAKPPLAAWVTAAAISDSIAPDISSPDAAVRDAGFEAMAKRIRTLALLFACATLVVTALFARLLADEATGLLSLLVFGSSLLFLRFCRYATTDINLMLWVTVTNLLLVIAIRNPGGAWWSLSGAGLALALAMMSKGPVALLETVVPVGIYLLLTRPRPRLPALPLITGLVVFAVVGLAWYALILMKVPNALAIWRDEISGHANLEPTGKPWYTYLCIVPYISPWIAFAFAGVITAIRRFDERDRLLLLLTFIPIFVMCLFHDKYERYLLPMFPALAIMTARAILDHLRAPKWSAIDRLINAAHWMLVAAITIGFPLVASGLVKQLHRVDGSPWLPPAIGWKNAGISAALILVCVVLQRRTPAVLLVPAAALMLGMQGLFMAGYSQSPEGRADMRPLAEEIWRAVPDAETFNAHPRGKRPPPDLAVYLSRTVRWISDPSALTPGDRTKVLLMLQDKGTPPPVPPAGWRLLTHQERGQDRWWAFVLDPAR